MRLKKIDPWLIVSVVLLAFAVRVAWAEPLSFSTGGSANLSRPCSHKGITSKLVSVSGTTARTTGALTVGASVMVTCRMNAFADFGASNNTAVADGTDVAITANVPYWFVVETSGDYVALIKESGAADGNCYVSECR